jgi:hypothetical protein
MVVIDGLSVCDWTLFFLFSGSSDGGAPPPSYEDAVNSPGNEVYKAICMYFIYPRTCSKKTIMKFYVYSRSTL